MHVVGSAHVGIGELVEWEARGSGDARDLRESVAVVAVGMALVVAIALSGERGQLVGLTQFGVVGASCATSFLLGRRSTTREAVGATLEGELLAELARSRRHDRPFVLARVRASDRAYGHVLGSMRSTDCAFVERDGVYVVMPETTRANALRWVQRLVEGIDERVDARVVAFPHDALTSSALLDALDGRVTAPPSVPAVSV